MNDLYICVPGEAAPADAGLDTMGNKAYGLLRLMTLGLPVPPFFTLSTALCGEVLKDAAAARKRIRDLLVRGLGRLETATSRGFGAARRPLLVSVRSGAAVSMPGMMDTILNIGLCEGTLRGFLRATGNPRLVRDCYRRLIRDFSGVVNNLPAGEFDALMDRQCETDQVPDRRELDTAALDRVIHDSLELVLSRTGRPFVEDPMDQLIAAAEAVFRSWESDKAREYRRLHHIADSAGTAVTVQAMVFGNSGIDSGAGVGFTRDPASGDDRLYLDFAFNSQGEDVVAGRAVVRHDAKSLDARLPAVAAKLARIKGLLEAEFHDMQDFEFAVERGELFLLQTRNGKRTPWAAAKILVALVRDGIITPAQALQRADALPLTTIKRLRLAPDADASPLCRGVSAGTGVASGVAVFDPKAAVEAARRRPVILIRHDLLTEDIAAIAAATGVLSAVGGRTSHAAVVARQLGKACLVGCTGLNVRSDGHSCSFGDVAIAEGDTLTIDADSGFVYRGALPVVTETPDKELAEIESWRHAAAAAVPAISDLGQPTAAGAAEAGPHTMTAPAASDRVAAGAG